MPERNKFYSTMLPENWKSGNVKEIENGQRNQGKVRNFTKLKL